jgi:anti-sigma B factor antagonist
MSSTLHETVRPWWIDVEPVGDITVVRLSQRTAIYDQIGYELGNFLLKVAESSTGDVVLNFGLVQYLNSVVLGRLFTMHKRLQDKGCRLILCQVMPQLLDVFQILKLPQLLTIYDTEPDSLRALQGALPIRSGDATWVRADDTQVAAPASR